MSGGSSDRDLFYNIVRSWRARPDAGEEYTLNQIASFALGDGGSTNAALIGRTIQGLPDYFMPPPHGGHKWAVRWTQIERDHPLLFYPSAVRAASTDVFKEMEEALEDEIAACRKHWRDHPIVGTVSRSIARLDEACHWYEAKLILLGDSELPMPEGVEVRLQWSRTLGLKDVYARLLSYEPREGRVILECESPLFASQIVHDFQLFPSIEQLLRELQTRLEATRNKPHLPVHRILENGTRTAIPWKGEVEGRDLDESQKAAVTECLNNDFTFLWGPPGTGKTYTLGRLIVAAALAGKRVLACAISNVAVDQLALKTLDGVVASGEAGKSLLEAGRILRFGHPQLHAVSGEPRLFPNRTKIQAFRRELHDAQQKHHDLPREDLEGRAVLQSAVEELKKALKELTKLVIHESSIVLTTAVQAYIEPSFHDKQFDLVIVDEASMMCIPYLAAVAGLSDKRIVVAGDFRQLGPISLAESEAAHRWLHRDSFGLAGIEGDSPRHPALVMLRTQRRMDEGICQLINRAFYAGNLLSAATCSEATKLEPLPGQPAVLIRMLQRHGSELCRTPQGSRFNRKSAEVTSALVMKYLIEHPQLNIGVVTPYRGQVAVVKRLLEARGISLPDRNRVTVGTIHAFQGSESDVIIWDLVDTRDDTIGRLYHSDSGERLGNVAVSRAKGKLVVVGDENAFFEAKGNEKIGKKLKSVFVGLHHGGVVDLEDVFTQA
jgi:hypothetical protein